MSYQDHGNPFIPYPSTTTPLLSSRNYMVGFQGNDASLGNGQHGRNGSGGVTPSSLPQHASLKYACTLFDKGSDMSAKSLAIQRSRFRKGRGKERLQRLRPKSLRSNPDEPHYVVCLKCGNVDSPRTRKCGSSSTPSPTPARPSLTMGSQRCRHRPGQDSRRPAGNGHIFNHQALRPTPGNDLLLSSATCSHPLPESV